MPNKPIINIEVDDKQFKAFLALFDEHEAKLAALPEEWQAIGASASASQEATAAAVGVLTESLIEAGRHAATLAQNLGHAGEAQKQFGVASREGASHLRSMAHDAKMLGEHIFGLGKFLFKLGALGGLGGLLGGFGLDKLAASAVSNQRSARALGMSTGEYRAFQTDMGRYLDPSALEKIANAKNDPLGRIWLERATGLGAQDILTRQPGSLAGTLAVKAHDWWATTPEAKRTNINLKTAGFSELGFTLDDMRRLGAASRGELTQAETQYNADSKRLDLSNGNTNALYAFQRQVALAGQLLETAFTRRLAKLGPSLGGLITALEKDAELLLNRLFTPANVDALEHGIDEFTHFLASDDFKKDVNAFLDALTALTQGIVHVAKWLMPDNPSLKDVAKPSDRSDAAKAKQADELYTYYSKFPDNPSRGRPDSEFWNPSNFKQLKGTGGWFGTHPSKYMGVYYHQLNPQTSEGRADLAMLPGLEKKNHLPAGLLHSMMVSEVLGAKNAISPAGAAGVMQLMPSIQQDYGVTDPFDFKQSATAGAAYMGDLLKRFHGDLHKALAGYNWGPNHQALQGNGESRLPAGVEAYADRIMARLNKPVKVEVTVTNKSGTNVAVSANASNI